MANGSSNKTTNATYSFNELIERIPGCHDKDELELYATVVADERRYYNLFQLRMIAEAFRFMREEFR